MIVGFWCSIHKLLADAASCVVIIQGLEMGVKDGMDILTLSLGIPGGWAGSTSSVIADRLAQNGTIITIAAGNEGEFGSWDASDPASGKDVICVGSVDKSVF
jgi:subtilisin family serine protease